MLSTLCLYSIRQNREGFSHSMLCNFHPWREVPTFWSFKLLQVFLKGNNYIPKGCLHVDCLLNIQIKARP